MNKTQVVIGHLFGDEGKGATVQYLCREALRKRENPLVVCFSGGPQNAHTVNDGTREHVCASFGSGTLLGVPTYHSRQYYVDPVCVINELEVLNKRGVNNPINMFSCDCRVITPFDVAAGRSDEKVKSDGTCGMGIYPTFKRSQEIPLTVWGLAYMRDAELLRVLDKIARYWGMSLEDAPMDVDILMQYYARFRKLNSESYWRAGLKSSDDLKRVLTEYGTVICEGSQGLLLDMDHGYAPHVTPSRVGINGLPEILRRDAEVFLVTRAYLTRHGNGYRPRYVMDYDWTAEHETNVWNQFQGNFKRGLLEINLLEDAFLRHNLTEEFEKYHMKHNLVITHCDTAAKYSRGKYAFIADEFNHIEDAANTPREVAEAIAAWLMTPRSSRVLYSDNWTSDFKELDRTPIVP